MPIEDVGQDPAGVLIARALARVRRHIESEARDECGDSGLPLATDLAHLAGRRDRPLKQGPF